MGYALVSINGVDLPTPSSYVGNTADLVDSGRNAAGYIIGSVIRSDVAKVELTYNYLDVNTWSTILKMFNPKYGGSFFNKVTFFEQTSGTWETREMYVSDRTTSGMIQLDSNGNPRGYTGAKFSLVER